MRSEHPAMANTSRSLPWKWVNQGHASCLPIKMTLTNQKTLNESNESKLDPSFQNGSLLNLIFRFVLIGRRCILCQKHIERDPAHVQKVWLLRPRSSSQWLGGFRLKICKKQVWFANYWLISWDFLDLLYFKSFNLFLCPSKRWFWLHLHGCSFKWESGFLAKEHVLHKTPVLRDQVGLNPVGNSWVFLVMVSVHLKSKKWKHFDKWPDCWPTRPT